MRAVVQRVSSARVEVDGDTVGAIGQGLCVLVGVTHGDTTSESERLADKLFHLRLFDDAAGVMNRSAAQVGGALLIVSQFTLYGDANRGRRPSWIAAAPPSVAEPLVDAVVRRLDELGAEVATGRFGADMELILTNDGPVTLLVDVDP